MAPALAGAFFALLVGVSPSGAAAHPRLDDAERHYARARVDAARAELDAAEASGELSADDLRRWLRLDALVSLAGGDAERAGRSVEWLAALEPEGALGAEFPPEMVTRFGRAQALGGLSLRAERDSAPDGVRVVVSVEPESVVDLVRAIEGELIGPDGSRRPLRGGRATSAASAGDTVRVWARAVGPGGAALAELGEPEAPSALLPSPEDVARAATVEERPADGGIDDDLVIGIGVGAAALVVVVIAVALAIWASQGAGTSTLGPPVWERP